MTINSYQAANLATQYHDVMLMVSSQSAFHLPVNKSPRQALEGYLQACKVCGVTLHSDAWEKRAEQIVEELTQKRRDVWSKMLGRAQ